MRISRTYHRYKVTKLIRIFVHDYYWIQCKCAWVFVTKNSNKIFGFPNFVCDCNRISHDQHMCCACTHACIWANNNDDHNSNNNKKTFAIWCESVMTSCGRPLYGVIIHNFDLSLALCLLSGSVFLANTTLNRYVAIEQTMNNKLVFTDVLPISSATVRCARV